MSSLGIFRKGKRACRPFARIARIAVADARRQQDDGSTSSRARPGSAPPRTDRRRRSARQEGAPVPPVPAASSPRAHDEEESSSCGVRWSDRAVVTDGSVSPRRTEVAGDVIGFGGSRKISGRGSRRDDSGRDRATTAGRRKLALHSNAHRFGSNISHDSSHLTWRRGSRRLGRRLNAEIEWIREYATETARSRRRRESDREMIKKTKGPHAWISHNGHRVLYLALQIRCHTSGQSAAIIVVLLWRRRRPILPRPAGAEADEPARPRAARRGFWGPQLSARRSARSCTRWRHMEGWGTPSVHLWAAGLRAALR